MTEAARLSDSIQIAQLHYSAINTGFLSSLGVGFLNALYKYLIKNETVIVYRDGEKVRGYVSCSLRSDRVMRKFLFYPEGVLRFLIAVAKKPSLISSSVETLLIPFRHKSAGEKKAAERLPDTELLSISVEPGFQKDGIGTVLLYELEKRLREKGVKDYKVVAGANLPGANNFYKKNGFKIAAEVIIHGKDISNIYCKALS